MQNFVAIESLRAWMAWWVVVGHALRLSGIGNPDYDGVTLPGPLVKILGAGDTAVSVFIIVSGFVITHLMINKRESYKAYITRRFFRIFPIYAFCLLLGIITTDLFVTAYIDLPYGIFADKRADRLLEQSEHFWTHLGLHLTLLHGMVPDEILPYSGTTFLSPAWSLSLEWQFYLIAPALIALLTGRPGAILATSLVILLVQVAAEYGNFGTWQYLAFLPLALNYFFLGIMSRAILEYKTATKAPIEMLFVLGIAFIAAGWKEAVIWSIFYLISLSEIGRVQITYAPVRVFARIFALNPIAATIGKWSYSTYLVHIPVFVIFVGGYASIFGVEATSQTVVLILLALSFPTILFISWILYNWIEVPFISLGRRFIAKPKPTNSALSA
ncbi:acyltransferase [Tistrella mobilis]|uniref:acyltransferase family protein n=1 Tax=Tistrella mobilis TaxID=171437 RepID=UPI003557764E